MIAAARSRAMTIAEALVSATARLRSAGIEDAPVEAGVLLCHALSISRERLYARLRDQLSSDALAAYESLLARRIAHEPSAYITGHREFYGLDFASAPDALIPRPETELPVDLALQWLDATATPRPVVADVGTGTGTAAADAGPAGAAGRPG